MNIERVNAADGTSIAFERSGAGPALILVGGAFCDRRSTASGAPLAALLAHRFTVLSYDRRGRGDSGDAAPYDVQREVDDLSALLAVVGGQAYVFGNSSGALLAFDAAVRGLPIAKLALYEAPLILEASRVQALTELVARLNEALATNDRSAAVELFLTNVVQMPLAVVTNMRSAPVWHGLERLAHTLPYDLRITTRGGVRLAEASAVNVPTVVMNGGASPAWMGEASRTLAAVMPNAQHRTLQGQTHDVELGALAQALEDAFTS